MFISDKTKIRFILNSNGSDSFFEIQIELSKRKNTRKHSKFTFTQFYCLEPLKYRNIDEVHSVYNRDVGNWTGKMGKEGLRI